MSCRLPLFSSEPARREPAGCEVQRSYAFTTVFGIAAVFRLILTYIEGLSVTSLLCGGVSRPCTYSCRLSLESSGPGPARSGGPAFSHRRQTERGVSGRRDQTADSVPQQLKTAATLSSAAENDSQLKNELEIKTRKANISTHSSHRRFVEIQKRILGGM